MKNYFAYTRVSTARQGEQGVSLQEQKSEIERYAVQKALSISEWFEERETAAKLGRPIFNEMLKRIRKGEAAGVIIHKIDRSARNLRDWVDITQLTEEGYEVHFIREALDMLSSSGRLAADVQAVVAANYVRNLREETIKGFYGRLKQGIFPKPAPLGYLDAGAGMPKTIDPVRGPLIAEGFRLYATGRYSQHALAQTLFDNGLRTRKGQRVSKNTLAGILTNPFYYGLIRIKKRNQFFAGSHTPLISKKLFENVQTVLTGRGPKSTFRHSFLFSRLIRCATCDRALVAEQHKGHIYYRCHSRPCTVSHREETIETAASTSLQMIALHQSEIKVLDQYVGEKHNSAQSGQERALQSLAIRLAGIKNRLDRLTDIYIDGNLDADSFNQRKKTLLAERLDCEQQQQELRANPAALLNRVDEFVELVKRASIQYQNGELEEKRQLLRDTMSNRTATAKGLDFILRNALSEVAKRPIGRYGGPPRRKVRTFWKNWVDSLSGIEET